MCGHDLRVQSRRGRRISWVEILLVLAVVAVGVIWLRIASQQRPEQAATEQNAGILPTNIPLITATIPATITVTVTATAAAPTNTPTPEVRSDGVITHVVRQGETLLGIAGAYGVTVEEIQAANGLNDVLIRAGDELIVPVVQPAQGEASQVVASRFEYTVQQGDTIISIASRFGSTVQEIQQANNLAGDSIFPGDVLMIPVPQVPPAVLASSPAPTPAPANGAASGGAFLTPQPETIYIEPRLIGPPDGAVIPRNEAALLRWISVDVLDANEWYVLLLYPVSGAAKPIPSIWTKATSYRLEPEMAPAEGQAAEYAWQVSVVRVKPGANSQYALEAASPPSELRRFTWR